MAIFSVCALFALFSFIALFTLEYGYAKCSIERPTNIFSKLFKGKLAIICNYDIFNISFCFCRVFRILSRFNSPFFRPKVNRTIVLSKLGKDFFISSLNGARAWIENEQHVSFIIQCFLVTRIRGIGVDFNWVACILRTMYTFDVIKENCNCIVFFEKNLCTF